MPNKRQKTENGLNYRELINPQTVLNDYMIHTEYPDPEMIEKIYEEFPNASMYISPDIFPKLTVEILTTMLNSGNWNANMLMEVLSMYVLTPEHTKMLIPHLKPYKFDKGYFIPTLFVDLESLELLLEHEMITNVNDELMLLIFNRNVMIDKDYQNKLCKILYKHHVDFKKWAVEKYKEIRELVTEVELNMNPFETISEKDILKHF